MYTISESQSVDNPLQSTHLTVNLDRTNTHFHGTRRPRIDASRGRLRPPGGGLYDCKNV